MAGITGDFAKLKVLVAKISGLGTAKFKQKLAKNISEEALDLINEGFEKGQDPYGNAWKPINPDFRSASLNGAGSSTHPLRSTGRLQKSLRLASLVYSKFTIATNCIYAAVHQYGATITPKNGPFLIFRGVHSAATRGVGKNGKQRHSVRRQFGDWVFAKSVTIPARPMMPANGRLPPHWKAMFDETAEDVMDAWMKKRA